MTNQVPAGLGDGFDNELGLTYLELTADGGRAQLEIHDKLLQPWGIVHGGVYCSIIESLASVSGHVWLSENGGGTVVGVNNNTDFLRAHLVGHGDRDVDADPPGSPSAAVADHHHRRERSSGGARAGATAKRAARIALPISPALPIGYPRRRLRALCAATPHEADRLLLSYAANWPAAAKHADCGSTTRRRVAADPSAGRLARPAFSPSTVAAISSSCSILVRA